MVTQMHSSMLAGAQLLWGFRSSPQSCSAELTAPVTELQGTSSVPQQFVEVGQRRQAQPLGQFSQEQFPGHTASCRLAEGICLALAPNFFPLLASSTWAPCGTRWAVRGSPTLESTSQGTRSRCSIQRPHGTIPAGQLSAYTHCTAALPTQTGNGDGKRGEWKTVGPHLVQP